jgi:chromosome segregation ATPase
VSTDDNTCESYDAEENPVRCGCCIKCLRADRERLTAKVAEMEQIVAEAERDEDEALRACALATEERNAARGKVAELEREVADEKAVVAAFDEGLAAFDAGMAALEVPYCGSASAQEWRQESAWAAGRNLKAWKAERDTNSELLTSTIRLKDQIAAQRDAAEIQRDAARAEVAELEQTLSLRALDALTIDTELMAARGEVAYATSVALTAAKDRDAAHADLLTARSDKALAEGRYEAAKEQVATLRERLDEAERDKLVATRDAKHWQRRFDEEIATLRGRLAEAERENADLRGRPAGRASPRRRQQGTPLRRELRDSNDTVRRAEEDCAAHAVDWRARAKSLEAVVEAARKLNRMSALADMTGGHGRKCPFCEKVDTGSRGTGDAHYSTCAFIALGEAIRALTPAPSTGKET